MGLFVKLRVGAGIQCLGGGAVPGSVSSVGWRRKGADPGKLEDVREKAEPEGWAASPRARGRRPAGCTCAGRDWWLASCYAGGPLGAASGLQGAGRGAGVLGRCRAPRRGSSGPAAGPARPEPSVRTRWEAVAGPPEGPPAACATELPATRAGP